MHVGNPPALGPPVGYRFSDVIWYDANLESFDSQGIGKAEHQRVAISETAMPCQADFF
jgi:hypothetical protein